MAKVRLRDLLIRFGLDSAEYLRKLNEARDKTGRNAKSMKRHMAGVQKSFTKTARVAGTMARAAGLAAGVGGGGLGLLVSKSANTQDELAKTSQKLGVARDDLVELRLAAERYSNFTEGTFDTALQRQVRRIAEAAQGTGEAQDAIRELGLDAHELAKMAPDEQFRAIAEAMKDIDSQGDRVRLAFKLYDTEGVGIVNTLMAGRDGFKDAREEAERFGLILSGIDSNALSQARQESDRLGDAIEGAGNIIAVQVAPATSILSREFTELVVQMGKSSEKSNLLGRSVAWLGGLALDIGYAWKSFFELMVNGWDSVKYGIELASDKLYDWTGGRFGKEITQDMVEIGQAAQVQLSAAADDLGKFLTFNWQNAKRLKEEYKAADEARRNANAAGAPGPANDNRPLDQSAIGAPVSVYGPGEVGPQDDLDGRVSADQLAQEQRLSMQRNFVEQMLGLESGMIDGMIGLTQNLADTQKGITLDNAASIAKGVIGFGKSLFGENKAFAIAEAIINTHRGITQALASAPPPLSYALAAAVAAKGFASVRAISSSSKGSKSGLGTGGGGGGSASRGSLSVPNPVGSQANGNEQSRVRRLVIDMPDTDRLITQGELKQILNGLGELIADDYTFEVRGVSSLTGSAA